MSKANKPRLGRGLSSLLSMSDDPIDPDRPLVSISLPRGEADLATGAVHSSTDAATPLLGATVLSLPLEQIHPNPHQPRRDFDEGAIAELAASLKSTGMIQPVIVRQTSNGYELIAGERRLRAAKVARLATVPAIVRQVDSYTQAQMALVENIQRQDLNPLERALAYRALLDQLGLTHGELANRLGEDRTVISHFLRLLDLSEPVRELVRQGKLSVGHGKLLAGVSDAQRQAELADRVVSQDLSVRNLERVLETPAGAPTDEKPAASAHLRDLEQSLSRQLGMKVQLKWSAERKRGKLVIFYDLDQFDDLKTRLGVVTD